MSGRTIELRVTASADASLRTVFGPFQDSAKRAQKAVRDEMGRGGTSAGKAWGDASTKQFGHAWGDFAEKIKFATATDRAESERRIRQAETEAKARSKIAEKASREMVQTYRRIGTETMRNLGSIGRGAMGVGREMASGMGVDLSVSGQMGKATSTNSAIVDAVNSGMLAKGKAGTPQEVTSTTAAVQDAGDKSKIAYESMANALKTYVERTGDLDEGKQMLSSMGDIAQATGSRVEDVAAAAGSMSKAMGNVPDKAAKIGELLSVISFQGAAGSVEMRQLAAQMPKVVANARIFESSTFTRQQAMGQLGAMAQFAVVGGAASASQATTSVQAFTDILEKTKGKKAAQIKAEYGVDFAAERDERGEAKRYKSPEQIITEVMKGTNGSPEALAKIFGNVRGAKPALGLAQVYQDAGGGKGGEQAIHEIFAEYAKGLTSEQVKQNADLKKASPAASAEELNNALTKIAMEAETQLLPSLIKLEPTLVKAFADVVSWAATNPGEAITMAIAASIAKAAIGEGISAAFKSAMVSASSGTASGLTGLGNAVGIASVALLAFAAGAHIVDAALKEKDEVEATALKNRVGVDNVLSAAKTAELHSEGDRSKFIGQAEAVKADLVQRQKNAKDFGLGVEAEGSSVLNTLTFGAAGTPVAKNQQASNDSTVGGQAALAAQIAALNNAIAAFNAKKLVANVSVVQNDGRSGGVK
jgi:hypothetical protein